MNPAVWMLRNAAREVLRRIRNPLKVPQRFQKVSTTLRSPLFFPAFQSRPFLVFCLVTLTAEPGLPLKNNINAKKWTHLLPISFPWQILFPQGHRAPAFYKEESIYSNQRCNNNSTKVGGKKMEVYLCTIFEYMWSGMISHEDSDKLKIYTII